MAAVPLLPRISLPQLFLFLRRHAFIQPAVQEPFVPAPGQAVVVFMITRNEQRGERLMLQPVQRMPLLRVFLHLFPVGRPDAPEVPADDDKLLFAHLFLLRKGFRAQTVHETVHRVQPQLVAAVGVPCDKNGHDLPLLSAVPIRFPVLIKFAPESFSPVCCDGLRLFRKKKKRTGADSPSGLRAVRAMPCAHAQALYHLTSESTRYRYIYPSSRYDSRRPVTTMSVPSSG